MDEPLTLTGIAQRLDRTPGSTKDYLTWLQDVDLVACDRKRYRFADPLLRLWVRINRGPGVPDEDRVIGEVQVYAVERLRNAPPRPAYAPALATAGSGEATSAPVPSTRASSRSIRRRLTADSRRASSAATARARSRWKLGVGESGVDALERAANYANACSAR